VYGVAKAAPSELPQAVSERPAPEEREHVGQEGGANTPLVFERWADVLDVG
jgi:hypothetical protein